MSGKEKVDDVDRLIGRRIAVLRSERNLSELQVARNSELTLEQLRAIEAGRAKVYASTLLLIGGALGSSVSELLPRGLN